MAQVTFKAKPVKGDNTYHALGSSIWKLEGEQWQMIFHQGTPCDE